MRSTCLSTSRRRMGCQASPACPRAMSRPAGCWELVAASWPACSASCRSASSACRASPSGRERADVLLERTNELGWSWLIIVEMFTAGVAAGAYVTAAILEVSGRGRSSVARVAQLIPFPLIAIATLLLVLDLTRSERFWHMAIMSEVLLPMFKAWSPMSLGTWLVIVFSGFAFVSFVDALIARRMLHLSRWRADATLHGSILGGG